MSSSRPKPDSSVAGSGVDRRCRSRRRASAERRGHRLAGHRRRPLADDEDPPDRAVARAAPGRRRAAVSSPRRTASCPSPARAACPAGSCGTTRRLGDLLEQEVGEAAAVDVAGGDLGRRAARSASTGSGRRRRRPGGWMPSSVAGPAGVEDDDLARPPCGRSRRPCGGSGRSPRPARRARWPRRRRPRPARRRGAWPLPRRASSSRSGSSADAGADGHRPLEAAPPWPEGVLEVVARRPGGGRRGRG